MSSPLSSLARWGKPPKEAKSLLIKRDRLTSKSKLGECLACGETAQSRGTAAHILFRSEKSLFIAYKNQGLLGNLEHAGNLGNLVHLCGNCHTLYDATHPKLTIIPVDLDLLLHHEREDYKKREQAAMETLPRQITRTVPAETDHDGKCQIILMDDAKLLSMKLRARNGIRNCFASPTAMILKAALAMGTPLDLKPPLGFPPETREKLTTLLNLWQRPPPKITPTPLTHPVRIPVGEKERQDSRYIPPPPPISQSQAGVSRTKGNIKGERKEVFKKLKRKRNR